MSDPEQPVQGVQSAATEAAPSDEPAKLWVPIQRDRPQIWHLWLVLLGGLFVGPCLYGACFMPTGVDSSFEGQMALLAEPRVASTLPWVLAGSWFVFAILGARADSRDMAHRLRLASTGNVWITTPIVLLGLIGVAQAGGAIMHLLGVEAGSSLTAISKMIRGASSPGATLEMAFGLGIAGAAEELFFRGYLQTRLVERWGRIGIAVTAVLFAALHLDRLHSPVTFGMGLFLGWAAYRTRSTRFGLLAHALNNFLVVLAAASLQEGMLGTGGQVVRLAIGLSLLTLASFALARRFPAAGPAPAATATA